MKALIIDYMSTKLKGNLEKLGFEVDEEMLPTAEKLASIIGKYDLLCMRVDPHIKKEVLDAATNLKAIMVGAAGLNHVDLEYAKEKGIKVYNAPGMNSNAVAELVFAKMLDLYRNTPQAQNEIKNDNIWNKYRWIGRELRNKTLGIIGFGAIGRRVAEIANVFHMNILAYDVFVKETDIEYVKIVELDEIIKNSDVITLHVPLTPDTKDMFSAKEMEQMKDGAIIINCARGGVVNEEDLRKYLANGKLGGANFDTMADELGTGGLDTQDVHIESPLFDEPRFYITPHIGGSTHDAQDDIGEVIIKNTKELFNL